MPVEVADFDMVVMNCNLAIGIVMAAADIIIMASSNIVVTDWSVAVVDSETEVPTNIAIVVGIIVAEAVIIVVAIITYKPVAVRIADSEWTVVIRNSELAIAADIAIANEITTFLFFNIKLIKIKFKSILIFENL